MNKRTTLRYMLLVIIAAFYQAAFGEIKVFFVEFIIVLAIIFIETNYTSRKLRLVVISVLGILIGYFVLQKLYPIFDEFLSIHKLYNILSSDGGYTNTNDINRLNGITILWPLISKQGASPLFGIGVGNAADGTAFNNLYSFLHYNWFAYSLSFTELGLIGLIIQFGIYIATVLKQHANINKTKLDIDIRTDSLMCIISCVVAIIVYFYDIRIFTPIGGLMVSYYISLPFLKHDKRSVNKKYSEGMSE